MGFYNNVDKGLVKSTMVLAVPRSVSSALAKAISSSPDISLYLFQPFYTSNDIHTELDEYVDKACADKGATKQDPLQMSMKVMAESVNGQRFQQLLRHSENICALVRDPQSQALSAYRAYTEKSSGKDASSEELADLKKWRHPTLLRDYIITPWDNMEKHVQQMERRSDGGHKKPNWLVLDGDVVRAAPEKTLKELCSRFDLTYSPRMVDRWKEEPDKTVGIKGKKYHRSWLGRVQQTSGMKKPSAMTPRLEDFSPPVRRQVIENLKTYARVLSHEQILAPSPEEMKRLMDEEDFHGTCPVACYALVSAWPDEQAHLRDATLARIREEKQEYTTSFDIIDQALGHQLPSERISRPARNTGRRGS